MPLTWKCLSELDYEDPKTKLDNKDKELRMPTWITNIGSDESYITNMSLSLKISKAEAAQHLAHYLEGKIVGEPRPTETISLKQLKSWGVRGVYEP